MSDSAAPSVAPALEITAGAVASPAPVAAPAPDATPITPPSTTTEAAGVDAPSQGPAAQPAPTEATPAADGPGETKPAAPALRTHAEELPSALSTEAPADPNAPKPDAKPADAPAPVDATTNYEFTVPNGITLPKERIEPYTNLLRENGITPAMGQKLLDMYIAERSQDAVNTLADQHRAFAETRRGWLNEVKADPELGGAGYQTTLQHAARGRDILLGNSPDMRKEYESFIASTGAGDHKMMFRLFLAADRLFKEPVAPMTQVTPTANQRGNGAQTGIRSLFKSSQRG